MTSRVYNVALLNSINCDGIQVSVFTVIFLVDFNQISIKRGL